MLGIRSGYSPYATQSYSLSTRHAAQADNAQITAHRAAGPETPVQPISPVKSVSPQTLEPVSFSLPMRQGADPAEMAVRMRMSFRGEEPSTETHTQPPFGLEEDTLSGRSLSISEGITPAEMAVRMRMGFSGTEETTEEYRLKLPGQKDEEAHVTGLEQDSSAEEVNQAAATEDEEKRAEEQEAEQTKRPQEEAEEDVCQTCENRKYQDGSDDPGVSFKTAGHIDPSVSASVVRGHEMEHVVREQAKADREGRKVVSQSVTLQNAICPECGTVYVSGGTTRTSTAAIAEPQPYSSQETEEKQPLYPSFMAIV